MSVVLTRHNQEFIRRMIASGRYNNQSEVLRAALARLEDAEAAYLNPPPHPPKAMARAYQSETPTERAIERKAVRASRVKPSMDT